MRWSSSVEWGAAVARVYQQLPVATRMHVVLPDLPANVITPSLTKEFFTQEVVPTHRRILTIAASRHSERSLNDYLMQLDTQKEAGHILVVGGNDKGHQGLSTLQAIRIARRMQTQSKSLTVWATANPNSKDSLNSVVAKLDAGATGIITQPLLSSRAVETLQQYPVTANYNDSSTPITYMAGLALPTSASNLMFWSKLLTTATEQQQQQQQQSCELKDDPLFREHVQSFALGRCSSTQWAKNQRQMLCEIDLLSGIHYMPLHNTPDLLALLVLQNKKDKVDAQLQ